ncbi:hypothetical protein [Xanthovirga aplysinae]|uniref:hypothetical protein n=1 Tax=Xanthovirga aplysinae TaxID=2529853 RepID=UPI0012BB4C27|nr:hypothetical protein [Xanthovirga aplysinae]MTI29952.1 hypothetical protein [Xanthovirga aplysinae]
MKAVLSYLFLRKFAFVVLLLPMLIFIPYKGVSVPPFLNSDILNGSNDNFLLTADTSRNSLSFSNFEVDFKGKITVTEDDRDIWEISSGGFLIIGRKNFGESKRVEIRGNLDGSLTRRYYEGRKKLKFEPEGREWLEEVLLEVLRTTGIDAKARVDRLYQRGKVTAVLHEVSYIPEIGVKTQYLDYLLNKTEMSDPELSHITEVISTSIDTDTRRAYLLEKHSGIFMRNEHRAKAYFNCLFGIGSDYERKRVLNHLLKEYKFNTEVFRELLASIQRLASSKEKVETLIKVNNIFIDEAESCEGYFRILDGMNSDKDRAYVMRNLLERNQYLGGECMKRYLKSARRINSDSEKYQVLKEVIPAFNVDPQFVLAFFDVIISFGNDVEQGNLLKDLLMKRKLDVFAQSQLFEVISQMSSDGGKVNSLFLAIKKIKVTNQTLESFYDAVNSISNSSRKAEVMIHLVQTTKLEEPHKVEYFRSLQQMSSNKEKLKVLMKTAEVIEDEDLKSIEGYLQTVIAISGNSEQSAALRELASKVRLNKSALIAFLDVSLLIASNTEKAEVLLKVSNMIPKGDKDVEYAYKKVVRSINSDHEYRRVIEYLEANGTFL